MMPRNVTTKSIVLYALGLAFIYPPAGLSQTNPEETEGQYASAGQQALASGNYSLAQANFEKLSKLEPSVAEIHATLGVIYFKQRLYDQAVQQVRTALKLKPALPKLDSLLGLALAEEGKFNEALPSLQRGFKQSADPEVRRMAGLQLLRVYTNIGQDSDAVETALALNKFYPKDPEVLYHTGRIYGNIAYVVMERLHDEGPGSIWMLQAQGEANESQKDYDAAIVAFNHELVLDPKRPGIHYKLGRVYLKRFQDGQKPEDRDAAVREFHAELETDPGNGNAAYELATIAIDQGHPDEARQYYEQVVARYPDFQEALVGLGGILLQSEKTADAVPLLKHATELQPEDKVAWYRLASAERELGHKEESHAAMAKYQDLKKADVSSGLRKPSQEEVTPQKLAAGADTQP